MIEEPANEQLLDARQIITRAKRLVVISGAGMSADSGIATFRGAGSVGGWDDVAPVVATLEGFQADPQRVWRSYLLRRREARKAEPHAGYSALVAWEQRAHVTVVTQNVDGLHVRSGSTDVIELHGSLFRFFCVDHHHPVSGVEDDEQVPRCPQCQSNVRPAVVWFGEWIPPEALRASEAAVLDAQAVLVIGTSLEVSSPKTLLRAAARWRTPVIEVNLEPALPVETGATLWTGDRRLPAATVSLAGSAAAILPRLLAQ